ncbi:unnamed protein product [Ophioblennius macclurei]
MEDTESTTRKRETVKDGGQETTTTTLMSHKPLHRFLQREPRSLGIVILIVGCAELLMGFHLPFTRYITSNYIYSPFWEGTLFAICGVLSIYTERTPSKKMVTVCLAMYIVATLGFFVTLGYRIFLFSFSYYIWYTDGNNPDGHNKLKLLYGTEAILFTCSVCVFVVLIVLTSASRLALKSTGTQHQVVIRCVTYPPSDSTPA